MRVLIADDHNLVRADRGLPAHAIGECASFYAALPVSFFLCRCKQQQQDDEN